MIENHDKPHSLIFTDNIKLHISARIEHYYGKQRKQREQKYQQRLKFLHAPRISSRKVPDNYLSLQEVIMETTLKWLEGKNTWSWHVSFFRYEVVSQQWLFQRVIHVNCTEFTQTIPIPVLNIKFNREWVASWRHLFPANTMPAPNSWAMKPGRDRNPTSASFSEWQLCADCSWCLAATVQKELKYQHFLMRFGSYTSFWTDQLVPQEYPAVLWNYFSAITFVLLFHGLSWHQVPCSCADLIRSNYMLLLLLQANAADLQLSVGWFKV